MPEMMSLTSVWAPKPTAMPTTPAPASSGPTCTPRAESAIMPAVTVRATKPMLRRMGSRVSSRERRRDSSGGRGGGGLGAGPQVRVGAGHEQAAVDPAAREVPREVGDEHDDERVQHAAAEAGEGRVVAREHVDVEAEARGDEPDGDEDEAGLEAALEGGGHQAGRLLAGILGADRAQQVDDGAA